MMGGLYHYSVDVYTHCQHKFMFKQPVKVNLASDDPFKKKIQVIALAPPCPAECTLASTLHK